MGKFPKRNEEVIERALNALRTIAPDAVFNGLRLAEIAPQAERSMATRRRLAEIDTMRAEQIALRETEDAKTLSMIYKVVMGVLSDDAFGEDSALYEAFGFVRRSQRKSGLTRKAKNEVKKLP